MLHCHNGCHSISGICAGKVGILFLQDAQLPGIGIDQLSKSCFKTNQMGTALLGKNIVAKAQNIFFKGIYKLNRNLHFNLINLTFKINWLMNGIFSVVDFLYIRNNSFRLMINNLLLFSWPAVGIENSQSGVQIRSLVKTAFQPVCLKPCLFKNFSVRKKINLCSSLLCPSQSRKKAIFQGNYRNPPFIGIVMNITVFINLHIHPGR